MVSACAKRVCQVWATIRSLWRVLLAGGLYSFLLFDEADIYISFLRTTVSCNVTGQVQGAEQTANWSGSLFCYDRNYVIGEATRIQGWLTAMGYALKVCSVFFLGIVADTQGRRVAMITGSVAMCVAFGLLGLNSLLDGGATLLLVVVSSVLQGLTNPATGGVSPFVLAMVADLSTSDTRGLAMTSYAAVRTFFSIAAFGLGYYLLTLELTDYDVVWASFAAVAAVTAVLFIFVVPETLHHTPVLTVGGPSVRLDDDDEEEEEEGEEEEEEEEDGGGGDDGDNDNAGSRGELQVARGSRAGQTRTQVERKPLAQALRQNPCAGCCIVGRSKFLRLFIVSSVLMYCAFGGTYFVAASYLMAQMRWTQANASLALFSQSFATIVGYGLNYWAVGTVRGESYSTFGIGLGCAAAGNLIVGLLAPSHVAGFWFGFLVLGVAYGFALPALPTIASKHAAPEEQAQLQSAFTVATMIGLIVASELHTNIYDENAVGTIAGLPFYASTGLLVVALLIHVLAYHCCRQKTSIGKRQQLRRPPARYLATTRATVEDAHNAAAATSGGDGSDGGGAQLPTEVAEAEAERVVIVGSDSDSANDEDEDRAEARQTSSEQSM